MTTGKTKVLTRRAFVGKVMSLLFNMMSLYMYIYTYTYVYMQDKSSLQTTTCELCFK